jgi:hypothetical protein
VQFAFQEQDKREGNSSLTWVMERLFVLGLGPCFFLLEMWLPLLLTLGEMMLA